MPIERSAGGGGAAAGGLVKLFDQTLGVAAASIDTGANGIAAGHGDLLFTIIGRTDSASGQVDVVLQFNGDTGANYDLVWVRNAVGVLSDVHAFGNTYCSPGQIPGTLSAGSYPGTTYFVIPSYDKTTFWKEGTGTSGYTDNAGTHYVTFFAVSGWRSTAAINQAKFSAGAGNLVAGSRMVIYGTQ